VPVATNTAFSWRETKVRLTNFRLKYDFQSLILWNKATRHRNWGLHSGDYGIQRRAVRWKSTYVSKEPVGSIFRDEE
jgi:hypothetical protein